MSADLIERFKAATAEEHRMLLLGAWLSLNPEPADWGDKDWRTWWTNKHRFRSMLDAEAYESAALVLVPNGWEWLVRSPSKNGAKDKTRYYARLESPDFKSVTWGKGENWITDHIAGRDACAWAATPALAIGLAALRAHQEQGT